MTVTVTADGPCRRTLNFSIERKQLDAEVELRLTEIAKTTHFKGFRKGKAPIEMVRKAHAAQLAEEARRRVMGKAFSEAVQEHELQPIGEPEMNLEVLNDDGEGDFTFEFAVEVVPDFELELAGTIPVTITIPAVDEDMIAAEFKRLQEQAGTLEEAEDGTPVSADDVLEGSVVYTVDGEALEARADKPVFLRHELLDGVKVEGLAGHFEGKQKGDTVELEVELPPHFEPTEHAGKAARAAYTIERQRRITPAELNAEFFERVGVESEEQLREKIVEALEAQRNQVRNQLIDRELDNYLDDGHSFPVPERALSKGVERRVHEYAHKLMEERGLSSEDGHAQAEERKEEIQEATERGLRLAFVLNRIAKEQALVASVEAAEEQLRGLARQQGHDPDATVAAARKEGWIMEVQEQMTHNNARAWLRERCEVTEQAPEPGDDGTAAEEA